MERTIASGPRIRLLFFRLQLLLFVLGAASVSHSSALQPESGSASVSEKPLVLVSVPPQAYFVDQISGGRVEVATVIPASASHNIFEPTVSQLKSYSRAKLYLTVGHPDFTVEREWGDRLQALYSQLRVINTSHGARLRPGDPHVWVSTTEAVPMIENIAQALKSLLPAAAEEIEARKSAFLLQARALHEALQTSCTAGLSGNQPAYFISAHPYWGYIADECKVVQLAIEQEGKEPTAADLAQIIKIGKQRGIRVVLVQPQYSEQAAVRIAHEIGAELVTLDPFAYDWLESMRRTAEILTKALA